MKKSVFGWSKVQTQLQKYGPGATCLLLGNLPARLGAWRTNSEWSTRMSRWKEVRINGDPINGLIHLLINGVLVGGNPLILTFNPNFLGHPSRNFLSFNDRIVLKFETIRTFDMMHERTHDAPKHDTFIALQVGFLEFFFKKPCSMSYLYSKFQKINIFRHILSTPTHPTKNMSSTSLSQIYYLYARLDTLVLHVG